MKPSRIGMLEFFCVALLAAVAPHPVPTFAIAATTDLPKEICL